MLLLNRLLCFSFTLVIGVAGSNSCRAAAQKGHPGKAKKPVNKSLPSDTEQLQPRVKEFLDVWLVGHDFKKSLLFFSAQATSNEVMLQADCGGYIKEGQRKSQSAVQAGIEKFLRNFASGAKGRKMSEQLDTSRFTQANPLKGLLNDVKRDKYLLVKLSTDDLGELVHDSSVVDALRSKLKSDYFYFSLISMKGGVFYLLWIKESGHWRIYHVDLICT